MSQPVAAAGSASLRGRQRKWLALSFLSAAGLLWGGMAWRDDLNFRDAIARIELEMANGRFNVAARRLGELLQQEPEAEEAAVLLGRCQKECGRIGAADTAFARVAPGSPFAHQAILARMRLAHDQGLFARAEEIIEEAAADPRNDGPYARFLLVPIYAQLGRLDEATRLIEGAGKTCGERAKAPRVPPSIWSGCTSSSTSSRTASRLCARYLDRASSLAPNDDRVRLGRAYLAIRTGDLADARRLLDACRSRRPEDAAVWAARLRLGLANGRVDEVNESLAHLPAERSTPGQIDRLEEWLAARRGDDAAERRSLEALIAAEPADLEARNRLAEREARAGESARAAELRREQDEIRRSLARYTFLYDRMQPIRDAVEMAGIAERLGRIFEARVFLTLAIAEDPDRSDLRRAAGATRPAAGRRHVPWEDPGGPHRARAGGPTARRFHAPTAVGASTGIVPRHSMTYRFSRAKTSMAAFDWGISIRDVSR